MIWPSAWLWNARTGSGKARTGLFPEHDDDDGVAAPDPPGIIQPDARERHGLELGRYDLPDARRERARAACACLGTGVDPVDCGEQSTPLPRSSVQSRAPRSRRPPSTKSRRFDADFIARSDAFTTDEVLVTGHRRSARHGTDRAHRRPRDSGRRLDDLRPR